MQQAVKPDAIVNFNFTLVPMFEPEYLHSNMRSAIARDLPKVGISAPHDAILSIVGGGPSLEDTYGQLTGYVAAINGSLGFLLRKGIVPQMCGVCDPSPHMVDIVDADPRVAYFLASVVHPDVYDKLLNAGCRVYRWNMSSVPGGEELLAEIEPESLTIGGGSTMGLRWLVLGYTMGFRRFNIHGMDSSFRSLPARERASHAYADHQDDKEWIGFEGFQTRPNFIGQLADFIGWMERLKDEDVEPIELEVFGEGLLQSKFKEWKALNPGWHEGAPKPERVLITDGFEWPEDDRLARNSALIDVAFMDKFLALVPGRQTVVQAGGNVGVYPANLAQRFHEVYSFEPEPDNFALMARNIRKVPGNIRAFNAALGARDGTCSLALPDKFNTGSYRVDGSAGPVKVRTIDELHLDACDLIWLDVEGSEADALKGASDTIERCAPAVIIEEKFGDAVASQWLIERGYRFVLQHAKDKLFLP